MTEKFEKAREYIKDMVLYGTGKNRHEDEIKALAIADFALEKQIPKKLHTRAWHWGETRHCPTCGHEILFNQGDFCSFCGQRLERSKE